MEKIQEKLEAHSVVLAEIQKDLSYHIHRTDLLQTQVDELRKFMWKVLGALTVAGPLLSAGFSWLAKKL